MEKQVLVIQYVGEQPSAEAIKAAFTALLRAGTYVDANEIRIKRDDGEGVEKYKLLKFKRSNQGTCINQRPIVFHGEHVDAMANWMGLNPLNVLCFKDNLTSGNSYTADVVFGSQNKTNFEVSKFEVFVYQTTPEETKLIDKFDYHFE